MSAFMEGDVHDCFFLMFFIYTNAHKGWFCVILELVEKTKMRIIYMKLLSKKYLYTSGLEEEQYNSIKPAIYEDNRTKLNTFSFLGAIFFGLMFIISFISNVMANNRITYMVGILSSLVIFLLAKFSKKMDRLVIVGVYLFMILLFWVGLQLSIVTTPNERTVTFIAVMLLGPIVFNDRPIRMIGCIGLFTMVFMVAVFQVKTGSVRESDLVNVFIYSILSMVVSTYMTIMKCERHFVEQEVKRLSRTDVLTGLYNRNAFTEHTDGYNVNKMPENFTVIYFDVNDLKGANDNLGHDAGDELIRAAANCIRDTFSEVGNCYRTGGDEFIVITEAVEKEISKLCQLFEEKTEKWTGRKVKKLRVSYGCASVNEFPEADFAGLQKVADERLYHNKRAFYSIKGNDRRGQRITSESECR